MDPEDVRAAGSTADSMDEDMTASSTAVEGAQSPLSTHTLDAHDDSVDLASSFYTTERSDAAPHSAAHPSTSTAVADDDDLMEPGAPSREEGLLDERIRARYIQEIGDIFAT
ncbi:predicted methyltransferase [Moesziomyces antarcticus T-34]|uniref:Predicted methyltransferase n=1 Tax=Pseudozyma antarctica (strain T-34) TaxID=1151754 RepID=M9MFU2_PSEA3|nr:predicted methyltransferase [Moesziomyces antarcticus T-34]